MRTYFSDKELKAVEEAVREAEQRTSGEIVTYVVKRSASYGIASWRAGAAFALVGYLGILLVSITYSGWSLGWLFTTSGMGLVILLASALGSLLVRFIPMIERIFVGSRSMLEAVRDRSIRAFVDEEVFNTRERTGILIFISLFERRVEVVGDAGINSHVDPEEWGNVIEDILLGIREKRTGDGLVKAIGRCGKLLELKGVEIREDDINELSDSVRFRSS